MQAQAVQKLNNCFNNYRYYKFYFISLGESVLLPKKGIIQNLKNSNKIKGKLG